MHEDESRIELDPRRGSGWRQAWTKIVIVVLTLTAACSSSRGAPERDGGPSPDGSVDAGDDDAGDDDAGAPPLEPEYTVVQGDCALLWRARTTGVPFEYVDADADGRDDIGELVVTYVGEFAESRILLRAGRDGEVIRSFRTPPITGLEPPTGFEVAEAVVDVDTGPDVDGDGVADLALRASWAFAELDPGDVAVFPIERGEAIQIVSGRDGSLVWQRLYREGLGLADLRWSGDANGDGLRDLLVGETREAGELVVLDGRSGAVLERFAGPSDVEGFPGWLLVTSESPLRVVTPVQMRVSEVETSSVLQGLTVGPEGVEPLWQVPDDLGGLAGGTLDVDDDGSLDFVSRFFLGEQVLLARSGASGEQLWRASAPTGVIGYWGFGFAIGGDANGDEVPDVAAGTLNAGRAGITPVSNVPGLFTISSGEDGTTIAQVVHDLAPTPPPGTFDNFGADIAAFDDPSERAGAAFAVSHELLGIDHWLTAWSCRDSPAAR